MRAASALKSAAPWCRWVRPAWSRSGPRYVGQGSPGHGWTGTIRCPAKRTAHAWGWRVSRFAAVFVGVISLPALFAPDLVLQPFLHDPATRALAIWPLRLAAAFAPLECVANVLMNALLGAGSSRVVLAVSVTTQWGLFLPLAWLVGPVLGYGMLAIWLAQAAYRTLNLVLFARSWESRTWTGVKL